MKKFKQGFTLIELLIVIVIIGILSVGFAPTLLNGPKKARDAMRKGHLANIQKVLEAYSVENGGYPVTNNALPCQTLNTAFPAGNTYFQGGVLPKDPVPASSACADGSYKFNNYPGVTPKCYVLGAKLEISDSGNSNSASSPAGFCNDTIPLVSGGASKDYYYVVVKY